LSLIDLRVFVKAVDRERAREALPALLERAERAHLREVDAEIAQLRTPADVTRWQRRVRRRLADLLGEFPERTPLRAWTARTLERSEVLVELVIFESRPNYYVTANLFRPARLAARAPGVLVPCGHAKKGKGYKLYRDAGVGLARQGYVALVYDPTGQGERSECYHPKTRRHWVHREVPQHHYTGKPLFLTGQTLAGWRTWDGMRALDYLCGRDEVDAGRIGVMGNSGGGAMTMLISAVDERVRVCAASHPGGSMENTHLRGRRPPDRLLYSLLTPRPCRIIVGDASGEEARHREKLDILRPFYRACGCPERVELVLVDGKHDLRRPKREASYEWLHRWLGREGESADEPPFRSVSERALWCTETGQVQGSLGGETMQTLNADRAAVLSSRRTVPRGRADLKRQVERLRRAVRRRIRFQGSDTPLRANMPRKHHLPDGTVGCLVFESEPRMRVPGLLFVPDGCDADAPLIVHTSDAGKPIAIEPAGLSIRLMRAGYPVFSIDVRDTGETCIGPVDDSDTWPPRSRNWRNFNGMRWRHDLLAIRALGVGRSRTAMRALDLIRAIDVMEEGGDLAGRQVVLLGEGRGGIWAMQAAAFDRRVAAVAAVRTLASYRFLTDLAEYNQFEHFWVPGVLLDYDVPDLPALVAPRPVWLLDPVDGMSSRLDAGDAADRFAYARRVYERLGASDALAVQRTSGSAASVVRRLADQLAEL
jgi:cephalosporin-C deacetylase-like acetyl esterase